jgi:glutathione S-transferase
VTYRLYNRRGSGGFVVEAALAMAEASSELVEFESKPGTPLAESFREKNPWRQVPTLILPDGSTMTETAAILIHLAACHPDKKLGPPPGTPEHAKFLRWLVFANVNIYESLLRRPYPERYTTDPNGLDAVREASQRRMGEALMVIENAIDPGPCMLGADMTVLDVYLTMLANWYRGELDAPRLRALSDDVKRHPVVGPIWHRHFVDRSAR